MPHSNETPRRQKPLLGLIMLREGLLDEGRLASAIERWRTHRAAGRPVPFGQVVLELGYCGWRELTPCLALQRKLATSPSPHKPLGHLLLELALLSPRQIVVALQLQRATGKRLGELLVEEEVLREPQLEVLLRLQARAA
ncbi:MAG: hypothetical protein VKP62_11855 [Candidatus Sericytochromatia bacterium]|nr:hypothetical protein [Candidatus Sericytochromatia bacterium]